MAANNQGDPNDNNDDTPFDALKDHSLKTAGFAYLVGDSALSAARLLEGDPAGAAGGALWAMGGITCAKYANPTAEQQLKLMNRRLAGYLQKQGVAIPDNPNAAELAKTGGLIDHIESFLYSYPSQILNGVYAIGGALVAKGGLKNNVKSDIACGALIVAGGLAGLLIPEKQRDDKNPPQGALQNAWAWMQEKPLRVSSGFYHANNIFTILGAFEKKKAFPAGKSHYLRFVTAASFIFANTMLSMSSKGHGGGDGHDEAMQKLATESAYVVAAQPPELREALIQNISGFLASQPGTQIKAEEISAILNQKLKEVSLGVSPVPTIPSEGWMRRLSENNVPLTTPSL